METNRQKDSFFPFSLDWDCVEVSCRALPKEAWQASLDLTWFSFPGTEELAAHGHMWIWWLLCILTNLSYYGKSEATDLNISRSVWVICMGTQCVAFQSWKGCYILCHPPFIELETEVQGAFVLHSQTHRAHWSLMLSFLSRADSASRQVWSLSCSTRDPQRY